MGVLPFSNCEINYLLWYIGPTLRETFPLSLWGAIPYKLGNMLYIYICIKPPTINKQSTLYVCM